MNMNWNRKGAGEIPPLTYLTTWGFKNDKHGNLSNSNLGTKLLLLSGFFFFAVNYFCMHCLLHTKDVFIPTQAGPQCIALGRQGS